MKTITDTDLVRELRAINAGVSRLTDLVLAGRELVLENDISSKIRFIQSTVATHFDLSVDRLCSRRRPEYIVWPRQIGMWMARQLTGATLDRIGRYFGGRDHGTVLVAIERVDNRMETEPDIHAQVTALRDRISNAIKKSTEP